MTEELPPKDARQGRSKANMLVVLVISMVLALVAFGIFEWVGGVPG